MRILIIINYILLLQKHYFVSPTVTKDVNFISKHLKARSTLGVHSPV